MSPLFVFGGFQGPALFAILHVLFLLSRQSQSEQGTLLESLPISQGLMGHSKIIWRLFVHSLGLGEG